VKQLLSVVKWPRAASPHSLKHQPAHSPYGGGEYLEGSTHSVLRVGLVSPRDCVLSEDDESRSRSHPLLAAITVRRVSGSCYLLQFSIEFTLNQAAGEM
jgi:hypothetical protein